MFVEGAYPNILFAKDGEVYDLDGINAIAIGGVYSVGKWYRLENGLKWFANEQPSDEVNICTRSCQCKHDGLYWQWRNGLRLPPQLFAVCR